MDRLFSTQDVRPHNRFDYWYQVACKTIVKHDSWPECRSNNAARWLRIPQVTIPESLHSRLIALKYLVFLGLVLASFVSWDLAMTGTEIEPFKAAIILRFMTEWPMIAYALALIAAGVFIERFYCRFACPLGGGLAILGRVRMFDWLHRHPECGSRCHHCETVRRPY